MAFIEIVMTHSVQLTHAETIIPAANITLLFLKNCSHKPQKPKPDVIAHLSMHKSLNQCFFPFPSVHKILIFTQRMK